MTKPLYWSADGIGRLSSLVREHNQVAQTHRTRLQDLKKVAEGGFARGGMAKAWGAVDEHLAALRKQDPGFDESKHHRDARGRFASAGGGGGATGGGGAGGGGGTGGAGGPPAGPGAANPGGGQRTFYADVASRAAHRDLTGDNAGYRAHQTGVIPETRYTELYPYVGGAAAALVSGVAGAFPEAQRRSARWRARATGAVAGVVASPGVALAAEAADAADGAVRRATGKPARSAEERRLLRDGIRAKGRAAVSNTARVFTETSSNLLNAPAEAVVRAGIRRADARNVSPGVKRLLRAGARIRGGALGVLFPGALAGYGVTTAMQTVGPVLDSAFPRRVEKAVAEGAPLPKHPMMLDVEEKLEKLSLSGATRRITSMAGSGFARLRGAVSSIRTPKAPKAAAAPKGKRGGMKPGQFSALRAMHRGGAVLTGGGKLLGAAAGAAAAGVAAGAAGAGAARVYYRDEEGRFTSKDKAVVTGTAAAVGAIGGAIGAAMLIGRRNANIAREAAARMSASADGLATQAGRRAQERILALQGKTAGKLEAEIEQKMRPFRQAAAAKDPVTWTHHVLDRRAEEAVDALVGSSAFRKTDPGRRINELPTLRSRLAGLDNDTPAATRQALADDIADIEAAGAAKSKAVADFNAWVQGGKKGLKPPSSDLTAFDQAIAARRRGEADWVTQLPRAQRARVEAIYAQRDAAKAEFAGRVAGSNQAVGEAERAHDAAKTAFTEAEARFKAKDAEAKEAQKAWGALPDTAKAKKAKAAEDYARLSGEASTLGDEAKAAKDKATAAAKAVDEAKKSAAPTAIGPAKDPWSPTGELIPMNGDEEALKAELKRLQTKAAGKTQDKVDAAMASASKQAREIALAAAAQLQARGNPVNGVVAREIARMAGSMAPRLARLRRDVEAVGSTITAAMGPGVKTVADYGRKVVSASNAQAFWKWVKANPIRAMAYASLASGATGVVGLDFNDDGSLNLSVAERKTVGETADTIRQRVKPVYRIWNAGTDQQLLIVGAVVEDSKGTKKFIHGTITQGNGKSRDIPTGADLEEVVRNAKSGGFSRQGAGNAPAGRDRAQVGAKESNDRWEKVAAEVERRSKFEAFGEGLAEIRVRDGSDNNEAYVGGQQLHQDEGSYKSAVFSAAEDAVKRGGPFAGFGAGEWFQHARRIFEGTGSPLLRFSTMRDLVWGQGDGKPGLVPHDKLKAIDDAIGKRDRDSFVAALTSTAQSLPPWRADRAWQEQQVLRTLSVLERYGRDRHSFFELTNTERGNLRSIVAGRKDAGGGSSGAPFDQAPSDDGVIDTVRETYNRIRVSRSDELIDWYKTKTGKPYLSEPQQQILRNFFESAEQRVLNDAGRDPMLEPEDFFAEVLLQSKRMIATSRRTTKSVGRGELLKATAAGLAKAAAYDETKHSRRPAGSDKGGEFAPKGTPRGGAPKGEGGAEEGKRRARPRREAEPPEPPKPEKPGYFEPQRFGETVGSAVGGQVGWELAQRFLPGPLRSAAVGTRLAERIAGMIGRKALGRYAGRFGIAAGGGVAGSMAGGALGEATYAPGQAPDSYMPDRPLSEEAARLSGNLVGETMLSRLGGPSLAGRIAVGTAGQLAGEELAAAVHDLALRRFGPDVANRAANPLAGPHRFT